MRANELNYIKWLKNRKEDALEFVVDKYLPLVKGVTYKILSSTSNEAAIEECINDDFFSGLENITVLGFKKISNGTVNIKVNIDGINELGKEENLINGK